MKYRDADRDYVAAFIDEKGGYMAVVNQTGIGKQTIWQLATKRNGISEKIADTMKSFYEDFDVARARGLSAAANRPGMQLVTTLASEHPGSPVLVELATLRAENRSLKAENSRLTETIEELKGIVAQLQEEIRGYARDFRKLAFPMASSYSPVFTASFTRAGFKHYDELIDSPEPECFVRPLWPNRNIFLRSQQQVART